MMKNINKGKERRYLAIISSNVLCD